MKNSHRLPADPFPSFAPSAAITFYRTYSRIKEDGSLETYSERTEKAIDGLAKLGRFTPKERKLAEWAAANLFSLPSGRWLWIGGTEWIEKPKNYYGAYNCYSEHLNTLETFRRNFNYLMCGCGAGQVLEKKFINQLPPVINTLNLDITGSCGDFPEIDRQKDTRTIHYSDDERRIVIGDSREGWVDAFMGLIYAATTPVASTKTIKVIIELSNIRPFGSKIKGFGGEANPSGLVRLFKRTAQILNEAASSSSQKLTPEQCCDLLDECGLCTVAGNVRRSAGMKQFDVDQTSLKENLYDPVTWKIEENKEQRRMSNHTLLFHDWASLLDIKKAVTEQFETGEGAIANVREAIARCNADILQGERKNAFLNLYPDLTAKDFLRDCYYRTYKTPIKREELEHRWTRYGQNPCAEAMGRDFLCNLSETFANMLNPYDFEQQNKAFQASSLFVSALLHHEFDDPKMQNSRELDPRATAGVTGILDFFINMFGENYLLWWELGRPSNIDANCPTKYQPLIAGHEEAINTFSSTMWALNTSIYQTSGNTQSLANLKENWTKALPKIKTFPTLYEEVEKLILTFWKETVKETMEEYCQRHQLKMPIRYTTVKPSGTLSLLTQASPGWHPPVADMTCCIRRITVERDSAVGLAAIAQGYKVIPAPSCKNEEGHMLEQEEIYHENCNLWLIEIPTQAPWFNLAKRANVDPYSFKATTKLSFYMTVQNYWTTDNTSGTLTYQKEEIDEVSRFLYDAITNNKGYVSIAMMSKAQKDFVFPRMPYQALTEEQFKDKIAEIEQRRTAPIDEPFYDTLTKIMKDNNSVSTTNVSGPNACDSEKCVL